MLMYFGRPAADPMHVDLQIKVRAAEQRPISGRRKWTGLALTPTAAGHLRAAALSGSLLSIL